MKRSEFDDFLIEFFRLFPSTKVWWEQLGEECRYVADEWFDILKPEVAADAKAAIRAILRKEFEALPTYDRELSAGHIRDVCVLIRQRREESRQQREDAKNAERDRALAASGKLSGPSARSMVGEVIRTMEANPGMSAKDAAALVIPPSHPDRQPRFECHWCCDSGRVLIWSARSIRAELDGTLGVAANRTICAAPCSCPRGDRFVWRGSGEPPKFFSGWLSPDAVFSVERHCHCPGGDTESSAAIDDFKQWVADWKARWEASKRHGEFDAWNNAPVSSDGF